MKVNRVQQDIDTLSSIIGTGKQEQERISLSSWRDDDNVIHEFFYAEEQEEKISEIRSRIVKIYEVLTDKSSITHAMWESLIDKFEELYNIDVFTLVSYIYMRNRNESPQVITSKVTSEVNYVLFSVK